MCGVYDMGVVYGGSGNAWSLWHGDGVWWVGECVESMTWGWCMVGRGMCGVYDMGMVYGGSGNAWSLWHGGWCMVGRGMCGVNDMGMVYGGSGNVWSLWHEDGVWWVGECVESITWRWCIVGKNNSASSEFGVRQTSSADLMNCCDTGLFTQLDDNFCLVSSNGLYFHRQLTPQYSRNWPTVYNKLLPEMLQSEMRGNALAGNFTFTATRQEHPPSLVIG